MNQEAIEKARQAKRVAVITGAGISAESGIPTFRGAGGLWRKYRAEELATPEAFAQDPTLVWEFYEWRRSVCAEASPNSGHEIVARMEEFYPEFLLITQNIDGLHIRAGNKKIIEIHGNIWKARCTACRNIFNLPTAPLTHLPLHCDQCNSLARPHIVWFGESYDPEFLRRAFAFLSACDLIVVVGTSGMVSIPVQFAEFAGKHGAYVIDINLEKSAVAQFAHAEFYGKAGEILPGFWEEIQG